MALGNDFKSVVICCGKHCSQLAVSILAARSFEAESVLLVPGDICCLKALWPANVCHTSLCLLCPQTRVVWVLVGWL